MLELKVTVTSQNMYLAHFGHFDVIYQGDLQSWVTWVLGGINWCHVAGLTVFPHMLLCSPTPGSSFICKSSFNYCVKWRVLNVCTKVSCNSGDSCWNIFLKTHKCQPCYGSRGKVHGNLSIKQQWRYFSVNSMLDQQAQQHPSASW